MISSVEILEEFARCLMSPVYVIETYFKTFDKTQEGFVQFKLFPRQKEVIDAYERFRYNLVSKPRQAGISTTTAAYLAVKIGFADEKNPEKILIIANKQALAQKFLGIIKDFLGQLPRWVWGEEYYGSKENEKKDICITNSKGNIILPNKSEVLAVATSKDALRGYTPTYLVVDEAAFIDNGVEVFGAAFTSLGTGGHAMLISTPNGYDPVYYATYDGSIKGDNDFHISEMKWYEDMRYNKDLKWFKGEEVIEEKNFTFDSYVTMVKGGYKPTSTWYEEMCRTLRNNARTIAQELDVSFLGSGGNVIDDEHIVFQENENVRIPIYKDGIDKGIWIWNEPIEGHKYILSSDVSRGDGDDYSTFTIIDLDTMEQVVEYYGKVQPDLLGELVYNYGKLYDAYVVVDITGGYGVATVLKLVDMGYKRLHYDDPRSKLLQNQKVLKKYMANDSNKVPGLNVNSIRLTLITNLERCIRENIIKIRSTRTIAEMRTFVYREGRPDHMKGFHDDCLKSDTLIKTIDGYKPISEINVGDLVMTHMGRYRSVEKILEKPFNGDWYDMKFQGQLNLGLSYNHPLYAAPKTLKRYKEREWITPDKWDKSDIKNDYNPRQISIIEKLGPNENKEIMYSEYYEKNKYENNNILDKIILDSNFAKFLGLFIADGHASKKIKYKYNCHSMSIAFHVKDEVLCQEIELYLNSLNISSHRRKTKGNGFALIFTNKFLWKLLSETYNDKREKILPKYAKYLGCDLKLVLEYWLKGDGWFTKRGDYDAIGATTSMSLALSMRDIAWSVGYYAVINECIRKRYNIKTKNQYWVSIRKDFRSGDRLKKLSDFEYGTKTINITKSNFNGFVYNLQVAEDESFIANGIVVHNCLMALGMALFVLEHSFKNLEKLKSKTKAMLDSWIAVNKDGAEEEKPIFVSKDKKTVVKKSQVPYGGGIYKNMQDPNGDYLWLFSGMK